MNVSIKPDWTVARSKNLISYLIKFSVSFVAEQLQYKPNFVGETMLPVEYVLYNLISIWHWFTYVWYTGIYVY